MTLIKIISGGQIGVDIAALRAAKVWGIQTGGWMPRNYKTLAGDKPEYKQEYGMKDTVDDKYPSRTKLNVRESHGTLRIASDWNSYGELATAREIQLFRKPSFDVDIAIIHMFTTEKFVQDWIRDCNIEILNVAGNARKSLEEPVQIFLEKVFAPWQIRKEV